MCVVRLGFCTIVKYPERFFDKFYSAPHELYEQHCTGLLKDCDMRRHMKFIFNTAFKTLLGFRVQPQYQTKIWHLDRWIKTCHVSRKEGHKNKGHLKCMCSFNLLNMFPPSLAVKAPRCAANETPLSGYSSWKNENIKFYCVCVSTCVHGRGHGKPL